MIEIHKTAIIEDTAIIMDGDARIIIGKNSYIGHHAIIGAPPQYTGYYPYPISGEKHHRGVNIGSGVCIREFAQVHAGILDPTVIDDNTLIMAGCHIPHDAWIGSGCTIGSFSIFGGHTTIDDGATLGQGVVTHPWVIIGEGAMVGLNSSVINDVFPYQKVAGSPAHVLGRNTGAGGERVAWHEDDVDTSAWNKYGYLTQQREVAKLEIKEKKS